MNKGTRGLACMLDIVTKLNLTLLTNDFECQITKESNRKLFDFMLVHNENCKTINFLRTKQTKPE